MVDDAVALQRPHVVHRTYRVRLHNMICGDHPRFVVVFLGMYLSCRDPLAIIYRGVLIFSRLRGEISISLLFKSVMTQKG